MIGGDFRIKIPLVGAKAENTFVPGLARRLDVEAERFRPSWRGDRPRTTSWSPTCRSGQRSATRCPAVAHWPDHDFVVTPDRHMTYAEAEEESGRLARRMLAAGMGKGTASASPSRTEQDWVVAWLAASRIGRW